MEGKRSCDGDFASFDATELRLGLPGSNEPTKLVSDASRANKRTLQEADESNMSSSDTGSVEAAQEITHVVKAQVVGWPPIRSCRRNILMSKKTEEENVGIFVKVSMDGAPYLRKIDLKVYNGYKELKEALEKMFKNFSLGELSGIEGNIGCEYEITYEDKDRDWMLAGDVPWKMFIASCKRMRIMRGSEAKNLGSNPKHIY